MIKPIIDGLKWIVKDFIDDIKWVVKVFKGEEKPKLNKEMWKEFSVVNTLKVCWTWYLLIFAAFFAGMFIAQQSAANLCNEYVNEELLPTIYEHYAIVPAEYPEIMPSKDFAMPVNKS